jgi:hypothetical protein
MRLRLITFDVAPSTRDTIVSVSPAHYDRIYSKQGARPWDKCEWNVGFAVLLKHMEQRLCKTL